MIKKISPFLPPANYWKNSWLSLIQLVINGLLKSVIVVSSFYWVKNLSAQLRLHETVQVDNIRNLIIAALFIVLLRLHERYTAEKMSQKYINAVRSSLLKRIMRASLREIQQKTIGNLSSRLAGDLSTIKRWLSLGISRLLTHTLLIVSTIGLIIHINPQLGAIIASTIILLISITMIIGIKLKLSIKQVRSNRISIHSLLVERLSAIATIKAMGQEHKEIAKINSQANKLEQNIAQQGIFLGLLRGVGDASALILISLFFGFNIFSNQALSVDEITALISIILFLNSPIRELGRVQEYYQGAKLSLNKVQELYQITRIVRGRQSQQKMHHYNGTVRVKNLYLENTFNGLSFNLKAGEHVALTGKNGSGKSTLLELLLGLIKPDQGSIRINGISPVKMLAHEKAKHLGTVGLNIVLLKNSIKNNIKYRHSKLSNKEMQSAIKLCQLERLIEKSPQGINSTVNESGKNFSSGEKARLSLCRAITASPSILLLDEPENYLDTEGLKIIKKLIKTYDATLVIATHNKELIQLCQRQINLDRHQNQSKNLKILKKNV